MSCLWSALMPHPPVLIPEIGRGRENEASKTLSGLEKIISAVKNHKPDFLIILSPHQPYSYNSLFVNDAKIFHGSFALYGVPQVKIEANSYELKNFCDYLEKSGIPIYKESFENLNQDQGSLVPLYFLHQAWGELPPVIIASPIGLNLENSFKLGQALAKFCPEKNFALLASGDLSHRLTPDAPAGYEPKYAPIFENAIENALKENSPKKILELDSKTLERAGECGLRSVMAMLGLVKELGGKIKIFSHEWPYGVGYCVALWKDFPAPVKLARETVARLLKNSALPKDGDEIISSELWHEKKSCFVSIKKLDGELRGCIGTLRPLHESLDREIISNAISASTKDPRFSPMVYKELDNVKFSVDVLSQPEEISSIQELNPKIYGVIVSKNFQRGVLLPDLEGVDTVKQQIEIAAMKAGIFDLSGIKLERFTVKRYSEDD